MRTLPPVFKEYDIRGLYGSEITEALATDIGRAFATLTGCRKVVVGRDMRTHSEPLFRALAAGLNAQGADVLDAGVCSTPMSYFANGSLGADASIMITASHNPKEYNGFKLCRAQAVPISGSTGIKDIERIIREEAFAPKAAVPGTITPVDVSAAYGEHVRKSAKLGRRLRVALDLANAAGIYEARAFEGLDLEIVPLYGEPDGTFPNHEGNPLKHETLRDLQALVRQGGFDFGAAFDGDADRCGFVDETGEIIPMDLITAVIARDILKREGPSTIFYDLRSSWAVKEEIEANGGKAMMSRVGHAFIKQQMRENDAVFAGELSGHYYFRDNYVAESSSMALLAIANIVSNGTKTLSEIVKPLRRYSPSGEINTKLTDRAAATAVMQTLKDRYGAQGGRVFELDGVSVEFPDWWFNVRCSNTEPLLRLNLEAKTPEAMAARRDEVLAIIRG